MGKVYRLIIIFVLLYCASPAYARHILGGNFELNFLGTTGNYELKLKLFFDKADRAVLASDNNYAVAIYRKSNNQLMRPLTLSTGQLEGVPFEYANEKCAASQGLKVAIISYSQNIYLDPNLYNDPQGYYVVWDRCCRNAASNIVNSIGAGMLFYLEFPPLVDASGAPFVNSSPQFVTPNGEYICKGQPFKFDNSATDADGDQRRYSFVTPYNGFSNDRNAAPNPQPSSNYPTISWGSGYDANTAIPSNPAMTIDADGVIRVTSDQLGLYVFSVEVEELRNGVVIGRARRDFQLKVIDCQNPPAIPVVFKELDPLKTQILTVDFCVNGFVEIATPNNPDYQFQWQKDNLNIADSDSYKLKVTESGEYTVVISYKQGCSGSSTSGKVIVNEKPGDKFKIVGESEICYTPTGTPLQIEKEDGTAFNAGGYLYIWTRNITEILPVANVFIQAKESGKYVARMSQISGICQYELEKDLTVNQLPEAILSNPTGKKVVCEGDSIPLRAANSNSTYIYDWQQNNVSVQKSPNEKFPALKSGIYKFEVTDGKDCKNTSDTVKLTFNPLTPVRFDTIFPACGTGNNRINLAPYVQPYDAVKGVFSGRGVSGTTYSPLLAGFGPSPIVYEYTNEYNCTTTKSRVAFVDLTPKVRLGDDLTIFKGDTVTLKSSISGGYNKDLRLNWSPSYALSSNIISRPLASPDVTTTYVLSATALSSNCTNQDTIVVFVKTKIIIPTAFTPDDDPSKLNEKWVLEGIEDYPNAEVKIFNRWGGEIFTTKNYQNNPFDGKKDNANLPMGTYYYIIKTGDTVPTLTGYVTIVR